MRILSAAFVITMDGEARILRDGGVAIDGQNIVAVGPSGEVRRRYPDAEVLHRPNSAILPGFVNTHNHMFQVLYRTLGPDRDLSDWAKQVVWPLSRVLGEDEAHAAALLCGLEMLRTGTTTVVDSHYVNPNPGVMDAVAEAVQRIGIRAVLGRASRDSTDFPLIPAGFNESPDAAQRAMGDLIQRWHGKAEGRIRIRPEPASETQASATMIRAMHEVATEYGTGMNIHVAEMAEQPDFIRAKTGARGSVDYLDQLGILDSDLLLAHCVWVTPDEIALMRERGVRVVHNPISNQFLGDGIAPMPDMMAAGVPVALGTDGPCSNDSLDMFGVMKAGALLHKAARRTGTATRADQILSMATRNGAIGAGLEKIIGSIEIGKRADVIIVGLRRPELVPLFDVVAGLVYAATGSAVETVIVDGQIVVDGGHLRSVDEDEIMRGAERLAWRMLRRADAPELIQRAATAGWSLPGVVGGPDGERH